MCTGYCCRVYFFTVGYEKFYIHCIILFLNNRYSVNDHSLPFQVICHIVLSLRARIMLLLLSLLFLVSPGHIQFDNYLLIHANIQWQWLNLSCFIICSLIQQLFIKCLLCSRYYTRDRGFNGEQKTQFLPFKSLQPHGETRHQTHNNN